MLKLSIVIPAYNEEKYIGSCLFSIFTQLEKDGRDAEVILVNNASTDMTVEVASHYPKLKIITENNKGLVHARRAGYLASSGDLVANIDADTMVTPGWFNKVFSEFEKDNKLVALSGPFKIYDLPGFSNFLVRFFYGVGYASYLINRFVFRVGSMLQGGNYIVRRSAFDKVGGFDEAKFDFYGEDADVARRLHKVGKVKFTFKLPIYASGRRLAAEGVLKSGWNYSLNYLWTIFFKKPYSKTHVDVRPQ